MDSKINNGVFGTMFGVPCIVADNFLKLATGEQIKVLIYVMRFSGKVVTSEEIAKNTGLSVQEVEESVMFWQQVNILPSDNFKFSSSIMQPAEQKSLVKKEQKSTPEIKNENKTQNTKSVNTANRKINYRPSEISEIMQSNSEFRDLCRTVEYTLGSINNVMQNTLIMLNSYYGLKSEVIIVLINYCNEIGKTSPSYIEKVGHTWFEKEICTLEVAQQEVERLISIHNYANQVATMFDMKRNPNKGEIDFIEKWCSMNFSMEMMKLACDKTIESINKISFPYINKILKDWYEKGITTVEEVEKNDNNFKKNKKSNKGNTFDEDLDVEEYKMFINNF